MKESAQAALSLSKARSRIWASPNALEKSTSTSTCLRGRHRGRPSAGVAISSRWPRCLDRPAPCAARRDDGLDQLAGLVLHIVGVEEKVWPRCAPASSPSCCRRAIAATSRNPRDARDKLKIVWIEQVDEAVATALRPRTKRGGIARANPESSRRFLRHPPNC